MNSKNLVCNEYHVGELIRSGTHIRIIRSGVNGSIGHCADVIREACVAAPRRKTIQIILPQLENADLLNRSNVAANFKGNAASKQAQVRARLEQWYMALNKLARDLAETHTIELRLTDQPHRYHAFLSDDGGIVGIGWHSMASIASASLPLSAESSYGSWLSRYVCQDFDWLWERCEGTPHVVRKSAPSNTDVDPILLEVANTAAARVKVLRVPARRLSALPPPHWKEPLP